MTLVYKTMQVSSVQLNKTPSAHCIGCPSPKAQSLSSHFPCLCPPPPPHPLSLWPLAHCCLCLCDYIYVIVIYMSLCDIYVYIWERDICMYRERERERERERFCLIPSPAFIQLPNSPPLRQLSVCPMCPRLSFYFDHQLILFIRFHTWVRSYSICLSLTGFCYLA